MARTFVAASSQYLGHTASAAVTAFPLSMACWFKTSSTTLFQTLVNVGANVAAGQYVALGLDNAQKVAAWTKGATAELAAVSTATYTTATWQHGLAVVASATDRRAYLNGGSKGTQVTDAGAITGMARTSIGAELRDVANNFANADLAEAAIWNIALSDLDATILATGVSPLFVRPDALVLYAPVLGQYSPEIDLMGRRDLTLTAAPATAGHPPMWLPRGLHTFTTKTPVSPGQGRMFAVF